MYVIDNKVFLHMVKCAGISVHQSAVNESKKIDFNLRHFSPEYLPERYQELPRYAVTRNPDSWYKSFYRFFLGVEGYMSFMLNDLKDDGYIYPIGLNEFIKRSINLKDTLIKYPNKARVFNNILRSQGNVHFINSYFKGSFDVYKPETLEQFNMSLYEWFYRGAGLHTVPEENLISMDSMNSMNSMNNLSKVEEIFDIKLKHLNKTAENKPKEEINEDILKLLHDTHEEFFR
ncbi:MAG: hypothetical protein U9N08_05385 [Candidatus Caldatribacteriota bacterium]|nr:hypothetical protein [Candidatus Caldatribacteriota bacterium]